jgi:hypothetical protein
MSFRMRPEARRSRSWIRALVRHELGEARREQLLLERHVIGVLEHVEEVLAEHGLVAGDRPDLGECGIRINDALAAVDEDHAEAHRRKEREQARLLVAKVLRRGRLQVVRVLQLA